jgi:hypothetical protein
VDTLSVYKDRVFQTITFGLAIMIPKTYAKNEKEKAKRRAMDSIQCRIMRKASI